MVSKKQIRGDSMAIALEAGRAARWALIELGKKHPAIQEELTPILDQLHTLIAVAEYDGRKAYLTAAKTEAEGALLAALAPRPKARKAPTKAELDAFIQQQPDWDCSNPQPRGCIKAAARHFDVDRKVISKVLGS